MHALWIKGISLILVDNFSHGHENNTTFTAIDLRSSIIRVDIRNKHGIKKLLQENSVEYIYSATVNAPFPDC